MTRATSAGASSSFCCSAPASVCASTVKGALPVGLSDEITCATDCSMPFPVVVRGGPAGVARFTVVAFSVVLRMFSLSESAKAAADPSGAGASSGGPVAARSGDGGASEGVSEGASEGESSPGIEEDDSPPAGVGLEAPSAAIRVGAAEFFWLFFLSARRSQADGKSAPASLYFAPVRMLSQSLEIRARSAGSPRALASRFLRRPSRRGAQ